MRWLEAEPPKIPVLERESDYPPMAVSLTTTLVNRTGSWRIFRPIYDNKLPPCNAECPAGEKIQGYLDLMEQKRYLDAYQLILESNPFPSITGRVCFHPCEGACNRKEFDEPIGIHNIERFLGDYGLSKAPIPKPAVRRPDQVCIIGSGPAGMTAAWFLALEGYPVTMLEAAAQPGGMLRLGIPDYRLPKTVLDREFRKLKALGVKVRTNTRVSGQGPGTGERKPGTGGRGSGISVDDLRRQFSIILFAHGAHQSRELGVPGQEAKGVMSGLEFLAQINLGKRPRIGKRVAVIGGGNTAIDAARSALRLGAEPRILYRRTRAEMPAVADEVEEALREGIPIDFLVAPVKVIRSKGRVTGMELLRMKLGKPDESGRRRPVPVKNSSFRLKFDSILTAIGEQVDLGFLGADVPVTGWSVSADRWGRTGRSGVYAAGDCVTGPKTVVEAIGMGRRAARAIDAHVTQQSLPEEEKAEIAQYVNINTVYFDHASRKPMPALDLKARRRNFKEVHLGYAPNDAVEESARCFSCGVCDRCDNCYVFCPDMSVLKKDESYEYDYDFCKGCGVCARECPRNAITMIEERQAK
jgi:2-oxoacid:acceptor oxidoreductase delta subunit (pyruvate/2-ketoisovalerate family)